MNQKACLLCAVSQMLIQCLNQLDVLNSNQRRIWGTNVENWPTVQGTSKSSCYLEEEKAKTRSIPNIVKDDLYVRKLTPVMPNPGNAFDQFLPKCWTPEDVNWKRIKRETYKPWYKEFQGFRFVIVHVSITPLYIQYPSWGSVCMFFYNNKRERESLISSLVSTEPI